MTNGAVGSTNLWTIRFSELKMREKKNLNSYFTIDANSKRKILIANLQTNYRDAHNDGNFMVFAILG